MNMRKHIVSGFLLLVFSAAVTGCSGKSKAELDAAKAEASKAKTELAAMKTEMQSAKDALSKSQTEKDALTAQIKTMTTELEKVKADLAMAAKERDGLQEQIKKLSGDQSGAVAQAKKESQTLIDDLKAQLAALTTKFTALQGENSKLQATLKDLQDKLKNTGTNLIPKL
jgi:chromosome segregation ATPase